MSANLPKKPQTIDDFLSSSLPAEPDPVNEESTAAPTPTSYRDALNFAKQNNFKVTSTTGGKHNTGSSHYAGRSIDVRTRDRSEADVQTMAQKAQAAGFIARDERVRPPGQKVWGGPHYHLEAPKSLSPMGDTIDSYLSKQPEVNDDNRLVSNDRRGNKPSSSSGSGYVSQPEVKSENDPIVSGRNGSGAGNSVAGLSTVASPVPTTPVGSVSGPVAQPTTDGYNATRPRTVTPAFNERDFRKYLNQQRIPLTHANLEKLRPAYQGMMMGDNEAGDKFLAIPEQAPVRTNSSQSKPSGNSTIGANDLAWHGAIDPSMLRQLNPSKRNLVLAGVAREMRKDDRLRAQGKPVSEPTLEQKNAFRAKLGLEAVSQNVTPNVARRDLNPFQMPKAGARAPSSREGLRQQVIAEHDKAVKDAPYNPYKVVVPLNEQSINEAVDAKLQEQATAQRQQAEQLAAAQSKTAQGVASGLKAFESGDVNPHLAKSVYGGAAGGLAKGATYAGDFLAGATDIAGKIAQGVSEVAGPKWTSNPITSAADWLRQKDMAVRAGVDQSKRSDEGMGYQLVRGVSEGAGEAAVIIPTVSGLSALGLGAASLPVFNAVSKEHEGLVAVGEGALSGAVYHYGGGLTGKSLGVLGNTLVWTAGPTALQLAETAESPSDALGKLPGALAANIPMGVMAGLGSRKEAPEPVRIRDSQTGEVRDATATDLPDITAKKVELVPPAPVSQEAMASKRIADISNTLKEPQAERGVKILKGKGNAIQPENASPDNIVPPDLAITPELANQTTVPPVESANIEGPPKNQAEYEAALERLNAGTQGETDVVPVEGGDLPGTRPGAEPVAPETSDRRKGEGTPPDGVENREGDRRTDLATRQEISDKLSNDMTQAEMHHILLTSDKTGGPNGRAYKEALKKPVQVASDIDGLKYLNDQHNHTFGDAIIKAKGDALRAAGVEGYHLNGDEFASQFDTPEQAREGMDRANEILQNKEFTFELPDGTTKTVKGVRFSYETGVTYDQADFATAARKKANYAAGNTVRGERPPGLSESYSKGEQVDKGEVVHHSNFENRQPDGTFAEGAIVRPTAESVQDPKAETIIRNAEHVSRALQDHFKLKPEEADAVSKIADARAETWAKSTGQPKEDWYKTHIADITSGGEPNADALYQREGFREPLPEERKALKIPPAWTDVEIALDPTSRLVAVGRDAKGRTQRLYSAEHSNAQLVDKFNRQREFHEALPRLMEKVNSDIAAGRNVEEATVLRLISQSGFRVGGEGDTGGKVKAYGASTLLPEHVTIHGDTVNFDFIGKLGVKQDHSITDADLARDLQRRIDTGKGQLFSTNDARVRNYLHSISGAQSFKVHDFRTWNATDAARKAIAERPEPTTPEEYWRARDEVGDAAAKKIGDNRQIALESYVDPLVFEGWREKAGVALDATRPKQARQLRPAVQANDGPLRNEPVRQTSVLAQGDKGSVEFLNDGRAVIRAFQSADVSTATHELAHVFRRDLSGDLLATTEKWAGVKDGNWTTPNEERFARGFERYLRTGNSPTEALQGVFAQFKDWLGNIYKTIKGSPIEGKVSPEMRDVFDRLLGKEDKAETIDSFLSTGEEPPTSEFPADGKTNAKQKPMSLPPRLDAAGLESGPKKGYDPASMGDAVPLAHQIIEDKGIDGAIEFVKNGDGIEWAATGYEVSGRLRAEESKLRTEGKSDEADAINKKRLDFLDDFAFAATKHGQAIVGIKAIEEFAPDRLAYQLNKLSLNRRKRGIDAAVEKRVTEYGTQLGESHTRIQALEAALAEATKRAEARVTEKSDKAPKTERPKKVTFQTKLEQSADAAKVTLKVNLGKLNLPKLERVGEKGAVRIGTPALEGDAELLAQYAAGRLAKVKSLAALKAEMVNEFGAEVDPHLSAIAQRAYAIRQEARLAEIADAETTPKERKTILGDIQKELAAARKAVTDAENADTKKVYAESRKAETDAERDAKAADDADTKRVYAEGRAADKKLEQVNKAWDDNEKSSAKESEKAAKRAQLVQDRRDAREAIAKVKAEEVALKAVRQKEDARFLFEQKKAAREQVKKSAEQAAKDKASLVAESRARLKQIRQEYKAAAKAEMSGYRETLKAQNDAAKQQGLWDTPLRNEASSARERLSKATDPTDPNVMRDLVSVAAEKFLPETTGGVARSGAVDPRKVYVALKDEFPSLVTRKNQGQLYKQGYQLTKDAIDAGRAAARVRSATKESRKLWDELGLDVDAQGVIIKLAQERAVQAELRRKTVEEFNRVSQSRLSRIGHEVIDAPRSLRSSIDAPLGRQGFYNLLTHPIMTLKGGVRMGAKGYAAVTPAQYEALKAEIAQHPRYDLAVKSGVDLTELATEADSRLHAEEQFQSSLASRLPHVRLSEQAFTAEMNQTRLDKFGIFATLGEANGYSFEKNPEFFQDAAKAVNIDTGRGDLPEWAKRASSLTNGLLWSSRLLASRAQLLNNLVNPFKYLPAKGPDAKWWASNPLDGTPGFKSYDPVMRKAMVGEVARAAVGMAVIYGLAKAAGFNTQDFPIVRLGNTRYDLSGGEASFVKSLLKLGKGAQAALNGEQSKDLFLEAAHIGRGKLAPVPGAAVDIYYGKDFTGEKVNTWPFTRHPVNMAHEESAGKIAGENIILKQLIPMVTYDFTDAVADSGWMGLAKAAPALAGLGVNTYEDRVKSSLAAGSAKNVTSELERLKISATPTTHTKLTGDKAQSKLTDAQQKVLAADTGKYLNPALEKLISSPAYEKMTDEAKTEAIKGIITDTRSSALERFKGMTFKERRQLSQGVQQ